MQKKNVKCIKFEIIFGPVLAYPYKNRNSKKKKNQQN